MILEAIYFLIPAALANMIPVFTRKINLFNYPVDFGTGILGKSKTFRGLIFGILAAIVIVYFQMFLFNVEFFKNISVVDYSSINIIFFGFLIGFGVLFGDMLESFFKRRLKIKPGEPWFPFDQIDSVLGVLIFVFPVYGLSFVFGVWVFLVWFFGHLLINAIGYLLGMKENWI